MNLDNPKPFIVHSTFYLDVSNVIIINTLMSSIKSFSSHFYVIIVDI